MSIPSAIALIFTLAISLIIIYFTKRADKMDTAPQRLRDVNECRNLLKSSTLEQRAFPNQRLVSAFGIDNAFTTVDPILAKHFVNRSKALLKTPSEDWKKLAQFASDQAKQFAIVKHKTSESFPLLPMVQTLVFHVIMRKFFPQTPKPSDGDVEFVTSRINSLWIASKGITRQDEAHLHNQKKELHQRLQTMFSLSESQFGHENPLNILLPAYETMWRVVLRIFLEVQFLSASRRPLEFAEQLESFSADPTIEKFEEATRMSDGMLVSTKYIVAEGLRLYPPTRRIYREIKGEEVAVDVECFHRDMTVWGENALRFVPARWASLTTNESVMRGYMPFGTGRFECPAKPSFGPFMIGIMVGVIVKSFGNRFDLIRGNKSLQKPLENGRDAYNDLRLRRKGLISS
ncbi:hypothetical protein HYFRA_00003603 [Hymenoscyphus fraxineus]|uniref:Cytochrome P450 n=1 Tax=Hymenoscyphus fraxineus TaxID=746836 RepID=A0A9N9L0U4_9HELO|nr:hypothetical protein HYFRA_00003603 [Hymenoscyphus fraxineus]